jgi:hypothetical protein
MPRRRSASSMLDTQIPPQRPPINRTQLEKNEIASQKSVGVGSSKQQE